jgi:hypothetical protein
MNHLATTSPTKVEFNDPKMFVPNSEKGPLKKDLTNVDNTANLSGVDIKT